MSINIGDQRKAGEEGPAGDQREAGKAGPAGDPRKSGEIELKNTKSDEPKQDDDQSKPAKRAGSKSK